MGKHNKERINSAWFQYKKRVWQLTEEVAHLIPGIENRGQRKNHIDHIASVRVGFDTGIPPEVIASLKNLRMLNCTANFLKSKKCDLTKVRFTIEFIEFQDLK